MVRIGVQSAFAGCCGISPPDSQGFAEAILKGAAAKEAVAVEALAVKGLDSL